MTNNIDSYSSGFTKAPLNNLTIGNYFDAIASQYPENPALVSRHQNIYWSYSQLQKSVDRLAAGLLALGINTGDRVGIWSPNCAEWYLTQLATAKMGAIMVCINPAYQSSELEYALKKVQCKALVTAGHFKDTNYLSILNELAPELANAVPGALNANRLPDLKCLIRIEDIETAGMYTFEQVCQLGRGKALDKLKQIAETLSCHDSINIQFTSGTTGSPKGATLTHHNILNNAIITANSLQLTAKDKLCLPVPLYHCFGMVLGTLTCMARGACVVLPGNTFDPKETLEAVAAEKCTALHGVPTMFIAELEYPAMDAYDLSTLRTGIMAGATCPIEVMKRVQSTMNMRDILIGYGQTETSPLNHITLADDPLDKRVETVGRAGDHLEIKIADKEGRPVPVGEKGEICCRGYAVMRGYWNDKERTDETIDHQGWLHSGDLGVMDTDGYTQVVGRIKDMIIRGGENIYPREIEEFLYAHPEIKEVSVFGVPDEKYGEQVCAWIQSQEGTNPDPAAIIAFCQSKIARFKIPRYIRFVDTFPMTVTGKIQKFKMRDEMLTHIAQGQASGTQVLL